MLAGDVPAPYTEVSISWISAGAQPMGGLSLKLAAGPPTVMKLLIVFVEMQPLLSVSVILILKRPGVVDQKAREVVLWEPTRLQQGGGVVPVLTPQLILDTLIEGLARKPPIIGDSMVVSPTQIELSVACIVTVRLLIVIMNSALSLQPVILFQATRDP